MIAIDPMPADRSCDRCGRPVSELKPFDPADPRDARHLEMLRTVYGGEWRDDILLAKSTRREGPCDPKAEKYLVPDLTLPETEDVMSMLTEKYGEREAHRLSLATQAYHSFAASWECRDCFGSLEYI